MAKQIEDIVVRLGLEKFEGLDKIRSSFRDLSKVTNLSERDINAARTSLFEFAKAAGNTEAVNKGLASALQGLRTQVDTCGRAYAQLTQDLNRLNEVSRGSTDTLERQRQALLNSANAGRQNVDSLQRQIDSLKQLQRETRPGSSAFIQLGKDIDNVTVKLGKLKSEAQGFNLALNQQAGATPSVLNNQIAILQRGLQNVRYDAEKFVDTLRQIQLLQITQSGRTGRAGVIAAYEAFQSPAYMGGFADPSRLSAMPDTTAALNQELAELSERLLNTARGSSTYTDVAIRMAEVQRQLRTDVMGTSEAFRQLSIAEAGAERRAGKLADIQAYYATQGPLAPGVGGYRDPNTGAMIAAGAYTPGRIRVNEAAYTQPIGPQPFPEAAKQALQSVESAQRSVTDIYERAFVQRAELQAKYNQIYIDKALEGLELEGQLRNKEFDTQLADFDRRMGIADKRRGRRLSGMQLAQGVGAALSGGIFGGPEGLIGGLGGLAVGGVGGAFAGAAAGAQVGMFRQQLSAVTDYSARIDKLQIALRGIVGSQDAYSQALAAAASVTRDLNIPQESAIQGMTRLSAAVLGAGGNVNDSAFAFTAIAKAIKATGGNAEQADGAILALTQVFSKGKVSAEELNQIAERLPGTFTLFAKATGRTGPELQKALQDGKVGLNDLMKFLGSIDTQYGQTALRIAKSTQDAGARLTVATQAMQRDVGKALQPIGAQLQDAFANFITNITPALVLGANAISAAIGAMYNAISAGFNILKNMSGLISGLTKTMIVFAGVSAGVFVASNITTFAGAIRNLVGVFRGLLSIQRALLAVETARAGAQALIAGLAAGATKGKVVGAILGGVAGAGVALGLGKIIEGVMKSVTDKIDTSISGMKDIPFTQFTAPTGAEGSAGGGRRAAKPEQLEVGGMLMNLNLDARQLLNTQLKSLETQIQAAYKDNNIALGESLELKKEDIIIDLKLKALMDEENKITNEIQKAQAKGLDTRQAELKLREVMIAYDETFRESEVLRTKRLKEQAQILADINQQLAQAFGPQQLGIFGEIPQQFTFERDPAFTPVGGTQREEIKRVADDLKKLTDPLAQLTSAAESLGSAFSTSFTSIISGSATAQQALATLFTNISNYFLDMAGKIIAKWIEMALLNTILSLFPGGGFGKIGIGSASMNLPGLGGTGALAGGGAGLFTNYDYSSFTKGLKLNAMGNAYAANGIVPFAMGGVVKRPTMFAFANGGAGRLGLMGEAGPEAIMPLRRLPSGRLGVEAAGGGNAVKVDNITINVENSGEQLSPAAQKQIAGQVRGIVLATLVDQRRGGGVLR